MIFNRSKFFVIISILNTRYKYYKSLNNNLFYFFNGQIDYTLIYYFADLKTNKYNINKFFTNFLIKFIIKNLLHYNTKK